MLRSPVATLPAVVVLALSGLVACDKKEESEDPEPPVVIHQVETQDLTHLSVASGARLDGVVSREATVQVDYPISIAYGVTQTGGGAATQFSFGLMQQLTEEEAAASEGNRKTCFLGSATAQHPGDGKEVQFQATFIIPKECAPNNEPATYNLYVGIDVPGQVRETGAEDDGNVVIYNDDMLPETRNQKCKHGDGSVGCIMKVTVLPSPGINLTMASLTTESSVAILEPLGENTGGTDDAGNPVPEVRTPLAKAQTIVALAGVNTDEAQALSGQNTKITYDICPEGLFHETCSGAGWKPLTVSAVTTANARAGHATHVGIEAMSTGEPVFHTNFLYAEGETFDLMTTGDWATQDGFVIRSCISSDAAEKVTGSDDGALAKLDNCQTAEVSVIRSDLSFTKSFASLNFAGETNAYTFTEDYTVNTGDPKTVRVDMGFTTDNVLNLDGASSRNSFFVKLVGRVNIKAVETIGRAAAYVSLTGSYVEIQQNMFNVALFTERKQVPEEYVYEKVYSYIKELCAEYQNNMLILVIKGSMCVGGRVGFEAVLTVKAKNGAGAPFDAATRVGSVTVSFGPVASVGASTRVSAGNEAARGGINGDLRLIESRFPVQGILEWGLLSLNPTKLGIKGTVKSFGELSVLNGSISAFADLREVDMCTKSWKICGKRFRMSYPCGFRWDRKVNENLVSFRGDTRGITLLSRSQALTLQ